MPSLDRLLQIAGISGIGLVCGGFWFKNYVANKMSDLEYYKSAMTTLRGNSAAMRLLGEPIRERRINIGDTEGTSTRAHRARMKEAEKLLGKTNRHPKVQKYAGHLVCGHCGKLIVLSAVPIEGSKQRGELYLWAERHALDVPWELLRLELALEKYADKRLLVYTNPKYSKDYVKDFDVDEMPSKAAET